MRLLLSAYACAPGMGSEPEVGLQALLAALQDHEVWVLTQPHMVTALSPFLAEHPLGSCAHLVAVEPAAPTPAAGLSHLLQTHISHDRWQRNAAREALRLEALHSFDLTHHVTLAAYWMRTGVAVVPKPFVWGPVGGGVEPPWTLVGELGRRGLLEDVVRSGVRRVMARRPDGVRTARRATVTMVQNAETLRRVRAQGGDGEVLPNALCVRVETPQPGQQRRRDVAVVGRVVGWKAVPLAVRAVALLPGVPLVVFGDASGSERERVLQAARDAGMADRLVLRGKLSRADLFDQVATSGAVLHPSLHDESPFGVAEALSLGTPVVALDHGGPPAVASHWPGAEVRLVRPGLPGQTAARLAAELRELLDPLRPVATATRHPDLDFQEVLREAYRRAVAASGPEPG